MMGLRMFFSMAKGGLWAKKKKRKNPRGSAVFPVFISITEVMLLFAARFGFLGFVVVIFGGLRMFENLR